MNAHKFVAEKGIDELSQENEKLRLDHAAYKKGVKNIIREKIKQIEGRDFTIAAMSRSLVLANAEVTELQKRVDAALFDMNQRKLELCESCDGYKDPVGVCQSEGLEMAINILKQALKGGESK